MYTCHGTFWQWECQSGLERVWLCTKIIYIQQETNFLNSRLQLLYSTYKCIKTVRKYFLPISKRKFVPYITNTEAIHV